MTVSQNAVEIFLRLRPLEKLSRTTMPSVSPYWGSTPKTLQGWVREQHFWSQGQGQCSETSSRFNSSQHNYFQRHNDDILFSVL